MEITDGKKQPQEDNQATSQFNFNFQNTRSGDQFDGDSIIPHNPEVSIPDQLHRQIMNREITGYHRDYLPPVVHFFPPRSRHVNFAPQQNQKRCSSQHSINRCKSNETTKDFMELKEGSKKFTEFTNQEQDKRVECGSQHSTDEMEHRAPKLKWYFPRPSESPLMVPDAERNAELADSSYTKAPIGDTGRSTDEEAGRGSTKKRPSSPSVSTNNIKTVNERQSERMAEQPVNKETLAEHTERSEQDSYTVLHIELF